jgi:hypothetical protein
MMVTPAGTLLNVTLKRVPKSAKPAAQDPSPNSALDYRIDRLRTEISRKVLGTAAEGLADTLARIYRRAALCAYELQALTRRSGMVKDVAVRTSGGTPPSSAVPEDRWARREAPLSSEGGHPEKC